MSELLYYMEYGALTKGLTPTDQAYLKNAESKHLIGQIGYILANEIDVLCNPAFWLGDDIPRYSYHSNILDLSPEGL